jgi:formate/nitrite transporter FocA (FNT family)
MRKRNITLKYSDISSISIRKARLTRGWLGLILLGIGLNILILCMLYQFLNQFYFASDFHVPHYPRRSSGIIIGILVILPVIISLRISKYFRKQLMLIIKWDHEEFRIKLSELNIPETELKRYLEGKGLEISN